ncbi:MAG TPA: ATP-binding protein, partial [Polyangiaceae bacterium]|nr:ATP-binding protein [Polyangiaceae bacterium]
EILAFMRAAPIGGSMGSAAFLDQAVFSKVLPRLRGDDAPLLREALKAVNAICKSHSMTRSAEKAQTMLALLERTGMTRFWA